MPVVLNLGCGSKTSSSPDVVNIDWSIYLRFRRNSILNAMAPLFFRGKRLEKYKAQPDNIQVYNLAKGIPFEDASVDVVYHSHVLEHLDRPIGKLFMQEVLRVLKPGGVQRIAVPDLEMIIRHYQQSLLQCEQDPQAIARHDEAVAWLYEQSVRRDAFGTGNQTGLRRLLERWILGDARARGETHQWMYDRFNLRHLLETVGFHQVQVQPYDQSVVPGWNDYGLDLTEDGQQYKTDSMYIEAVKPV